MGDRAIADSTPAIRAEELTQNIEGLRQMKNTIRLFFLFGVVLLHATTASAHPIGPAVSSGVTEGILHPLLGADHLLAMVAVGLLAAQMGGQALWSMPLSFLSAMVGGGVYGMVGLRLPAVEYAIAFSIVLLGAALCANKHQRLAALLAAAAVSGLFHGHAHGMETPVLASPAGYAAGFVVTTAALHLAGILGGRLAVSSIKGLQLLRLSGAAMAVFGALSLVSL
jgi:urease accessory protein